MLALREQVAQATRQRFNLSEYDVKEIQNMLFYCYKAEVERRNVAFVQDDATKERVEKVGKWLHATNCKPGLLLYSDGCGTGKTTMARAVCTLIGYLHDSCYSDIKKSVRRVSALQLTKIYQDDPRYFNRLQNEDLLFIDDLGVEPVNVKVFGNEFSPLTELIYSRYDFNRWTLVSTNLNEEQIDERYGSRISDRFNEMFERIYFAGTSYRK